MPFNMGPMELFIVLIIILVLFGAKRVPEIGSSLGKGIREFKKSMNDVQRSINEPEREERFEREPLRPADRLPSQSASSQDDDRPGPKRLLS